MVYPIPCVICVQIYKLRVLNYRRCREMRERERETREQRASLEPIRRARARLLTAPRDLLRDVNEITRELVSDITDKLCPLPYLLGLWCYTYTHTHIVVAQLLFAHSGETRLAHVSRSRFCHACNADDYFFVLGVIFMKGLSFIMNYSCN